MIMKESFEISKMNYHDRYLLNIPEDIDPKFDNRLWDIVYNLNVIYLDLVKEWIMDDEELYVYVDDWCLFFELLRNNTEPEKVLLLSVYLHVQYERIVEWCLDNEYYEGLTNLRNFNDLI